MNKTTTETGNGRLFEASWIDRVNDRLKGRPIRAWAFFVLFALALIAVQVLFLWLDDGLQEAALLPVILFNGFFTALPPGLIYYLDDQAVAALDAMRSVLDTTAAELERYQYKISNMPARPSLITGLVMVVFTIFMEGLWIAPVRYAALAQLPIFTIVFQIIDKSSAFLFGVFIYHTVRQLHLVHDINSNHIRVNLFNLRPLQAF